MVQYLWVINKNDVKHWAAFAIIIIIIIIIIDVTIMNIMVTDNTGGGS